MCMWCPWRPERGHQVSGTGVGFWEQVLLTAEPLALNAACPVVKWATQSRALDTKPFQGIRKEVYKGLLDSGSSLGVPIRIT